jgi:molecular chaperone DnaK (HSP70)
MPCFKSACQATFGLEPSTTLNTDEAASRGAALKCAILSPTFRVREFNIVDSVINEITINWSADSTGSNSGSLKIFEKKGQFPFTKAMTIYRKSNDDFELSADLTGDASKTIPLSKYTVSGINPIGEDEEKGKKVKLYFRMDGSGLFSLSACEQIEKFEEWVEVPVEKKPEPEKKEEEKKEAEKGEPMDTDKMNESQEKDSAEAMDVQEDKKEEGDAPQVPETKKEKKIKQRKSPLKIVCTAQLGAIPDSLLNKFLEIECQLKSKDKEEKDKSDAKNELEELVYSIRDKLYSSLEKYVQEGERSNLSKTCDEIEDWLYGDGEDQPKNVYVERKTNLDAAVAPVRHRATEHENRQSSLNKLTDILNFYQKIVGECEAKLPESKYIHLDAADVKTMSDSVREGWTFFQEATSKLKDLKTDQDPPVTNFDILSKSSYIDNVCKPISQKKPPKVEPPKEEKPAEGETASESKDEPMEESSPKTENPDDLD